MRGYDVSTGPKHCVGNFSGLSARCDSRWALPVLLRPGCARRGAATKSAQDRSGLMISEHENRDLMHACKRLRQIVEVMAAEDK